MLTNQQLDDAAAAFMKEAKRQDKEVKGLGGYVSGPSEQTDWSQDHEPIVSKRGICLDGAFDFDACFIAAVEATKGRSRE